MKLAVIGNKEFKDYRLLAEKLDRIEFIDCIVSGGAPGADTLAKQYSKSRDIEFREFPPDYANFGREAKHIRDRKIVDNCDKLIAFWDGHCEGTQYTLNYAKETGKPVKIIPISL